MSEHPDIEALSAYHDGEAPPELAVHVADCEACTRDLARLVRVSGAVRAPVTPLDPSVADSMIRRAMASSDEAAAVPELPRPLPLRPDKSRWLIIASVAAAVVMAVGLGGLLTRRGGGGTPAESASRPAATTADRQLQAPPAAGAASLPGNAPIDGGDLGEITDERALVAMVETTVRGKDISGAADTPSVAAPSESGSGPVARTVGTRACELEARAVDPSAGALAYVADADYRGATAKVLGFAPPSVERPLSLFLLAQDGCRLLARATLP